MSGMNRRHIEIAMGNTPEGAAIIYDMRMHLIEFCHNELETETSFAQQNYIREVIGWLEKAQAPDIAWYARALSLHYKDGNTGLPPITYYEN